MGPALPPLLLLLSCGRDKGNTKGKIGAAVNREYNQRLVVSEQMVGGKG